MIIDKTTLHEICVYVKMFSSFTGFGKPENILINDK